MLTQRPRVSRTRMDNNVCEGLYASSVQQNSTTICCERLIVLKDPGGALQLNHFVGNLGSFFVSFTASQCLYGTRSQEKGTCQGPSQRAPEAVPMPFAAEKKRRLLEIFGGWVSVPSRCHVCGNDTKCEGLHREHKRQAKLVFYGKTRAGDALGEGGMGLEVGKKLSKGCGGTERVVKSQ